MYFSIFMRRSIPGWTNACIMLLILHNQTYLWIHGKGHKPTEAYSKFFTIKFEDPKLLRSWEMKHV